MPTAHDLPPFLRQSVPVELTARLQEATLTGDSALLRCTTSNYRPEIHNYYGTNCETVFEEPTPGALATMQIDFCTDSIVRFRYAPGVHIYDNETPMVVGKFDETVKLEKYEDDQEFTMRSSQLRVEVVREPFQIKVTDYDNQRVIWSTRPVDIPAFRRPHDQWKPPQQRWLFYHRYAYPLGVANHGDMKRAFLSCNLAHDEHLYGFGESYGRFDKRETTQTLWHQEAFGNASPASYKRIPFFLSTSGYGLFFNTAHGITCHVGDREHTAFSAIVDDTNELDFYLIYGEELKDILSGYTDITGKPGMPPKWSFGLWMGRISYGNQSQVETVADELREHEIPCDVIHIDTDWFENDWQCDLEFSPTRFPDPAGMMSRLRENGFRVSLWQWPNMIIKSKMFEEARDAGYLVRQHNDQPYLYPGFYEDAGFIDYSNPEAVTWVQNKLLKLFQQGAAVIKADFGEGAPPSAVYANATPAEMHNLFPLLYNKAIFDITRQYHGKEQGIIWARSAWAGSQRYPLHWSGDGVARFEDLACVLRATLSFGMSGFPFYSHDIGGFSGLPDPALYVRWAQLALFSSHARAHGTPPREPWNYGEDAEDVFRFYDEMRYRLLPYIYTEALDCTRDSTPFVRPLVLDYTDDPTTFTIDDQYLFGRSILVAPILTEKEQRRVYLPEGEWIDYWGKELIHGGQWQETEATLEILPLYIRAGAIIPYAPLMQHTGELTCDPLTLEIYHPADSGEYVIHDENRPDIAVSYRRDGDSLVVSVGATPGEVELVIFGVDGIHNAEHNGNSIDVEQGRNDTIEVTFDGSEPCTIILTP